MINKYDYGIYKGVSYDFSYKDKEKNISDNIKYMLNRSLQMFKYENLPETIPKQELEKQLQTVGSGIVAKIKDKLYILNGSFSGEPDVYNNPTKVTINNIALDYNETLNVGVDCEIIKSDDMSIGLLPIFAKYSTMLSENEITMILSTINKRSTNILSASDDNTSDSAKEYIKKLEEGTLSVVMDNKLYESFRTNPLSEMGTSTSSLIDLHQYLKATMYNEIGLKDNINMKKERLIEDELNSNNDIIFPLVDSMLNCRRSALEKINKLFGTNITVDLGSSWEIRKNETLEVNDPIFKPIVEPIVEPDPEPIVEPDDPIVEPDDED